jgi:hypothetical protein
LSGRAKAICGLEVFTITLIEHNPKFGEVNLVVRDNERHPILDQRTSEIKVDFSIQVN